MTNAVRTRRVTKVPGYLLHKKSGQARVRLNGVDHYLGPHGSDESHQKYNTLIAEYLAGAVFDQNGVARRERRERGRMADDQLIAELATVDDNAPLPVMLTEKAERELSSQIEYAA